MLTTWVDIERRRLAYVYGQGADEHPEESACNPEVHHSSDLVFRRRMSSNQSGTNLLPNRSRVRC